MKKTIHDPIDDSVCLAEVVRKTYGLQNNYPLNIFSLAKNLGVYIKYVSFESDQPGRYYPPYGEDDIHLITLSAFDDITRQRFTLAHEIAHYLRYIVKGIDRKAIDEEVSSETFEEKFAENFSSHLLVPNSELKRLRPQYEIDGYVPFEHISDLSLHFGVTRMAMLFILAYRLNLIDGETDSKSLRRRHRAYFENNTQNNIETYMKNRIELYSQAIDVYLFELFSYDSHQEQQRIIAYIFNELVSEGVSISINEVAELYMDTRGNKNSSIYCGENEQRFIETLGQCEIYKKLSGETSLKPDLYDIKNLHRTLYSYSPCPEYSGQFRQSNAVIYQRDVTLLDYKKIQESIYSLASEFDEYMENASGMGHSEYVYKALVFHHRLTTIHPFADGNGRVLRAFLNTIFKKRDIPFIFFEKDGGKQKYLDALQAADVYTDYKKMFLLYLKMIVIALAD